MHRLFYILIIILILLISGCDSELPEQTVELETVENPLKDFSSIEDAEAEAGFHCPLPERLPKGYSLKGISTISGRLIQVIYHTQGNLKINYRVAKGNEDISGIYGSFAEKLLTLEGVDVLARLSGKRIAYATWQREGYSFAVSFDEPVTESVFVRFVESIPTMNEELEDLSSQCQ